MDLPITEARARFSELLQEAGRRPQFISKRGRRVAVVLSVEDFEAFDRWRRAQPVGSLSESLDLLRAACEADDYALEVPARRNRPNAFPRRR